MYSLRKLLWSAYLVVGGALALIIVLGFNQYALSGRYTHLIEQSERAIFQFGTLREVMTEKLVAHDWKALERVVPDLEKLNSDLARLQENTLIPVEYKLALADKVDLGGIILSVRRIADGGGDYEGEVAALQERLRILAEHLLKFDRIVVNQTRSRLLDFQMIVIGIMGVLISLAVFSLNGLYQTTVRPLLRLSRQLQRSGRIESKEGLGTVSREVDVLISEIESLSDPEAGIMAQGYSVEEMDRSRIVELVNDSVNRLNGIINYAQLLADDEQGDRSKEERELLERIIESGQELAGRWQELA